VFRSPSQKWDKEIVQSYKAGKDISIMVWGAIWKGGRSDLVIMTRNESLLRGGYSANLYIDVLDEQIPICFEPGRRFMQDNARIHTAKKVKSWFEDNSIPLLEWPPYSPDINPIENVWAKMKELIVKHHPKLSSMGKSVAAMEAMSRAIIEAWKALLQEYIDNLIEGMPKRVKALEKAKGWHIKY
jgi:DDE superfamily endonuclease